MAAFVVLGHLMIPVLFLVFVSGVVFGPWLGTLYAMAGALASASTSFGLGRALGADWTDRLLGGRARRIAQALEKNGVLAVFLMRKIPAPFALVNLAAGSSRVRFLDFLFGTLLGMGPMVVAVAAFGPQVTGFTGEPTIASYALSIGLFLVALSTAYLVNRILRKRRR